MIKHLAIMQQWPGEKTYSLCLQYPMSKEDECLRMLTNLRRSAYQQNLKVVYKIEELDGPLDYAERLEDEARKASGVKDILFLNGNKINLY